MLFVLPHATVRQLSLPKGVERSVYRGCAWANSECRLTIGVKYFPELVAGSQRDSIGES